MPSLYHESYKACCLRRVRIPPFQIQAKKRAPHEGMPIFGGRGGIRRSLRLCSLCSLLFAFARNASRATPSSLSLLRSRRQDTHRVSSISATAFAGFESLFMSHQDKKQTPREGVICFSFGGRGGIRTLVPLRTTAFRVRLVATTSILFRLRNSAEALILPCRNASEKSQIFNATRLYG